MIKKLFVVGDSISMHYGPFLKCFLEGSFAFSRKGGLDGNPGDLNKGSAMNGGDSSAVLAYLKSGLEPVFEADILLLNCGLHDIKTNPATGAKQVPKELYKANLKEIFALLKAKGLFTAWVRTTPVCDQIHNSRCHEFHRHQADEIEYNQIADEAAATAGIPSIDLNGFTRKLGSEVFGDHVHFREEIRALQAAFLAGHLLRLKERLG